MPANQTHIQIGVDGGGTGCRAIVSRGETLLTEPIKGGRANVTTDPQAARANLCDVVSKALHAAGLGRTDLLGARLHFGLAGAIDDSAATLLAPAFPGAQVSVSDDQLTTLAGALGSLDGAIAGIGTGSFIGQRRNGNIRFVGGWGGVISDQAAGGWLGRHALVETVFAHDGLQPFTDLSRSLMEKFDNDITQLVTFARDATPSDFATFAPIVTAGIGSDALSDKLIAEGAHYIEQALKSLDFVAGERLCLTGGLGPYYAKALPDWITSDLQEPAGTALDGALQLARQPA